MKTWLGIVVVGFVLHLNAQVVIEPFAANGVLTWHSAFTNATGYAVEWAPTVTGPWSRSWANLTNVSALAGSNSTYSVSIPMFYRVVVNSFCEIPGDCCEYPTVLPGEGTYEGTTLGYSNNVTSGANCAGVAGPDRFYSIVVPAGKRLHATVLTLTGTFDPSIGLQLNCNSPRSCLSGDDSGSATTMNGVTYDNRTGSPLPVLIVIDTYSSSSPGGPFSLGIGFSDIPPGENCSNAIPLAGATVLTGQSTTGYLNDSGTISGCTSKNGPDCFYSTTVPPGQKLTVTAAPDMGFDCAITLSAGCPATTCLGQADLASYGVAETAQYTNASAAAQTVYIAIDSSSLTVFGTFTLTTALTAP